MLKPCCKQHMTAVYAQALPPGFAGENPRRPAAVQRTKPLAPRSALGGYQVPSYQSASWACMGRMGARSCLRLQRCGLVSCALCARSAVRAKANCTLVAANDVYESIRVYQSMDRLGPCQQPSIAERFPHRGASCTVRSNRPGGRRCKAPSTGSSR